MNEIIGYDIMSEMNIEGYYVIAISMCFALLPFVFYEIIARTRFRFSVLDLGFLKFVHFSAKVKKIEKSQLPHYFFDNVMLLQSEYVKKCKPKSHVYLSDTTDFHNYIFETYKA
jgi:hypothetical protein